VSIWQNKVMKGDGTTHDNNNDDCLMTVLLGVLGGTWYKQVPVVIVFG
jgi:hypothetical protein